MKAAVALIGLVWTSFVSGNFIQPQHSDHNQIAEVACWKFNTSYILTFYLTANGDRIDNVYTVNSADASDTSALTFSSSTGTIAGSGTTNDPYTFTITGTGDLPGTPITLDNNNENVRKADVTDPDVISVKVMSKAIYEPPFLYHVVFPDDVLFIATCNFTEIEDQTVTTGSITVNGDVIAEPYLVNDTAVLNVLADDGTVITSTNLGDLISLQIDIDEPTHATGVFAHNCIICNGADCTNADMLFIDEMGCSTQTHISPFVRSMAGAQTQTFESFVLNNQGYVYFSCKINFCYETNDLRCDDYCAYSIGAGRRKRQADVSQTDAVPDRDVFAVLRITVDGQGVTSASGQYPELTSPERLMSPQTNMVLLGAVIALASLLCVGLVVAVIVFCRISSTTRSSDTKA